jgi:hypothetical protein
VAQSVVAAARYRSEDGRFDMAFNNVGPEMWLAEGKDVTWWYTRDGGANFGTQFASADIKISDPANPGAILVADQQGKQVFYDGETWRTTYYVRITNIGPGDANFNLQGGGMV